MRNGVQEKNLDILLKNEGFHSTDTFFAYTSGKIGPHYFDSGAVMKNGHDYDLAVESMANLIFSSVEERYIGCAFKHLTVCAKMCAARLLFYLPQQGLLGPCDRIAFVC